MVEPDPFRHPAPRIRPASDLRMLWREPEPSPKVSFLQRPYPSANSILLHGPRPALVDSGFGADVGSLVDWMKGKGVPPDSLSLLVNTHSHCDHAGGNHVLQQQFGTPVAASAAEAGPVNDRATDACRAEWLRQPIEPYEVRRVLADGDLVGTSLSAWRVVATPGHTAGHISLHCADLGVLILGDALHDADLGWMNPYREGADSLDRQADTLARLRRLPATVGYSGHGPAIADLPAAFERADRRVQSWRAEPERMAWHACKRIFSHALMLEGGVGEEMLAPMLLDCPWVRDHAVHAFRTTPEAFVPVLVSEMLRSRAAAWHGRRLVASAPHTVPQPGWARGPTEPAQWPKLDDFV